MLSQFRINSFGRLYNQTRGARWRFTMQGKIALLALLISGIIGFDIRQNISFQIFSIILALILFAVIFSSRKRGQFQVQRSLPSLATMGQAFNYRVSIVNNTKNNYCDLFFIDKLAGDTPNAQEFEHFHDSLSKSENIFDRIVGFPRWVRLAEKKTGARESSKRLDTLPSQQKKEINIKLTPLRRGYLYFSSITIGTPDTLGLFLRLQNLICKDKLLVLPKRYAVPPITLKGKGHYHQGGISLTSAVGEASEFHGLRDYRPGDALRHIHWRSWARTDKPVVKTFEQEYFVRHALVLDTYAQDIPSHHFEEAVSVAASLALRIDDQESLLDLMFVGHQRYRITSGRHVESIQSLLEVLACVQPQYHNSIDELTQMLEEHSGVLSNVLCIFLHWDEQRQTMVDGLRVRGVNVIPLIVCDKIPEKHDVKDTFSQQPLFYLQVGDIEAGLAQLKHVSV